MDALTKQILAQLSGSAISQISQQIGAEENVTGSALTAAMPLHVSALANNTSQPDGAQALHQALGRDHDGAILNDMSGFLNNPQAANGAGILGHVLGNQQSGVTQGLAKGTGLDSNQVGQLLEIAAPLLMGALGQQQQKQSLDVNDLSSFLNNQQQVAHEENPDLMGTLNRLLDLDGDGSALDDIIGIAGKLFGNR